MAQYKVPQDVEADDKLLGPFSFRQFVYLMVVGGCIALAIGLFQIFPLLAILPVPVIILFAALALPLKKDQPMETYLAAIVSYYLKPRTRLWVAGQKESPIDITAPKVVDDNSRTRDISEEEASHRLSFLANIVDTGGYAIKGVVAPGQNDLAAEAYATNDMFESGHFERLEATIAKDEVERHEEVMREMRDAIDVAEGVKKPSQIENVKPVEDVKSVEEAKQVDYDFKDDKPDFNSDVVVIPGSEVIEEPVEKSNMVKPKNTEQSTPKSSIIDLANNDEFSVATIAKEADRLKKKEDNEVFISLH